MKKKHTYIFRRDFFGVKFSFAFFRIVMYTEKLKCQTVQIFAYGVS